MMGEMRKGSRFHCAKINVVRTLSFVVSVLILNCCDPNMNCERAQNLDSRSLACMDTIQSIEVGSRGDELSRYVQQVYGNICTMQERQCNRQCPALS